MCSLCAGCIVIILGVFSLCRMYRYNSKCVLPVHDTPANTHQPTSADSRRKSMINTRVGAFRVYLRKIIHKNDAVNRGRNYAFGAGVSDSCIITIVASSPTSSTTKKQKECEAASIHTGERGQGRT